MNKNVITIKTALSTGIFLGGVIFPSPIQGAEIDYYTSSVESSYDAPHVDDSIVQPTVSFDCNADTEITIAKQDDTTILNNFAESMLNGMKSLDSDISKWVDDNFWDLV